jgi:hypothetical protein
MSSAKVQFEKVEYKGWNAYRLSNGVVDLVIPADIGIRIMRFGFVGGANMFAEFESLVGKKGGDEWRLYGGHRLWHAPEDVTRTYIPDNDPVEIVQQGASVVVRQPLDATGIAKEIEVTLHPEQAQVRLVHRLRNTNHWAVEFAPWALSVMAQGGQAIIPLPPRGTHPEALIPTSTLILWAYTDLSDPRWTFTPKYVLLRQDPNAKNPQKIGAVNPSNWLAYTNGGNLFVKGFTYVPNATYPDMGSNVETFTNNGMLEVETLAPLSTVQPGETVEHVETWHLFPNVQTPTTEAEIDALVEQHIARTIA